MLYATSDLYMFHRNPRKSFEPYKCCCVQYQCTGSKGRVFHNSRTQMGVPQLEVASIGWMVYFLEHPNLKWMITGGTPMALDPSHGWFINALGSLPSESSPPGFHCWSSLGDF